MTWRAGVVLEDAAVHEPEGVSPGSVMRAPGRSGGRSTITVRLTPASAEHQVERVDGRINVRIDARVLERVAVPSVRGTRSLRADVAGAPSAALPQRLTDCDHLNAGVFHLHGEAYGPGVRYAGTEHEPNVLGGARSHLILPEEENGPC
jgi:hypothetical protein